MAIRDMKYNIVQKGTNYPLTWDNRAIDFDSEDEAVNFADVAGIRLGVDGDIKHQILYYDGGYISGQEALTNLWRERRD
jgi:hypothetical protein